MGGIDSPTDTDLLLATYKGGSHLTSDIQNGGTIMIKVNAMGDACPIPIVKTKNAIRELQGGGTVETRVDNEIAVQNLTKMANQKGYGVHSEKISDNEFVIGNLFRMHTVSLLVCHLCKVLYGNFIINTCLYCTATL